MWIHVCITRVSWVQQGCKCSLHITIWWKVSSGYAALSQQNTAPHLADTHRSLVFVCLMNLNLMFTLLLIWISLPSPDQTHSPSLPGPVGRINPLVTVAFVQFLARGHVSIMFSTCHSRTTTECCTFLFLHDFSKHRLNTQTLHPKHVNWKLPLLPFTN